MHDNSYLCIVDGTFETQKAIDYAIGRAKFEGAEIVLLGIVPYASGGTEMIWGDVQEIYEQEFHEKITSLCEDYSQYISSHGLEVSYEVQVGHAPAVIRGFLLTHHHIQHIILAIGAGEHPGPIIKELTSGKNSLNIPMILVPKD